MTRSIITGLVVALGVLAFAGAAFGATPRVSKPFDTCGHGMFLPSVFAGRWSEGKLGVVGYHEGDTATHELWDAHQACVR